MRILLHGYGSRGDVEPTLALALGLQRAGHDVALAAALDFRELVEERGVGYEPFDIDLGALSRTPEGRAWLGGTARNPVDDLRLMRGAMREVAPAVAETIVRTTDSYDAVVTTPILLEAMLSMSVARGLPLACALLQPSIGTAHGDSYVFAPRPGRRSPVNYATGAVMSFAIRPVVSPIGNATRRLAGLPPLGWRDYVRHTFAVPFVLGASPAVVPPAPDWPVDITVSGYWPLEPATGLSPEVEAFLEAGPPPVYIGFGSMSAADSAATSRLVADAVRRAGVRALVHRGAADLHVAADDVLLVGSEPHGLLFPRVAAVVGHGGAGTTGAAFRAGVPQVVVPHMGDQPYWARRAHELGVAPAPLPRKHLTSDSLADGIRAALTPGRAAAARLLGERLRQERGVAVAVERLERAFSG